jgi:hypothetical protein
MAMLDGIVFFLKFRLKGATGTESR